jgi:NAD-dependent SIR2 family protein deacetylase
MNTNLKKGDLPKTFGDLDKDINMEILLQNSAHMINHADAIAIFAGAGMGVDSGLEQYRGNNGLWTKSLIINNKPVYYYDLMKPVAFKEQPELAWGLIGYLMEKYRITKPHIGFSILKDFLMHKEYFIVTSNTDQQFQKAGFSTKRIFEIHGSIFNTQCGESIECGIWETPDIKLDSGSIIANSLIPVCPFCNSYCRPNVHLFDDEFFVPFLSAEQQFRYMDWREEIESDCQNIIALEIGAGKTISTIRKYAEGFVSDNYPLIRINPNDSETDKPNHISIPLSAREYLIEIKNYYDDAYCPF